MRRDLLSSEITHYYVKFTTNVLSEFILCVQAISHTLWRVLISLEREDHEFDILLETDVYPLFFSLLVFGVPRSYSYSFIQYSRAPPKWI